MSFTLAVWRPNGLTPEGAELHYRRLAERPMDDWSPSPDLRALVDEVTGRFEADPWEGLPLVGADEVLMAIAWPVAGAVAPVVLDLAKAHGLMCFDPQSAVLHDPAALTPLSLVLSDGKTIPSPTRRLIERHLRRLSPERWFVIIEAAESNFIQVGFGPDAGARPGWFALDHRTPDAHWQAETPDVEACVEAVFAYLDNDAAWSRHRSWRPLG